ncbi:Transcription factor TFIIIC triple barrel domain-containing protein [Madurella fahalii]|uniref:Transcription factor TFIIIC triple barrel domain-containing protein n=1 Tax=Madurella fahalii TaxID=1157608 RepID=A0ABQ0G000_9PEZI
MLANYVPHQEADGFGIDHHLHQHHHHHAHFTTQQQHQVPTQTPRKRKPEAAPENNERLSKRMSLLNLGMPRRNQSVPFQLTPQPEQSGQKLYVPVENSNSSQSEWQSAGRKPSRRKSRAGSVEDDDSQMRLDDTKYKVYIYNLDDELSESDAESESGKLLFLPDIEKHLRTSRIPPLILEKPQNAAAGRELVLYSVPSSISVPAEKDSVRRAIIEARARAREKQAAEKEVVPGVVPMDAEVSGAPLVEDPDAMELD